MCSAYNFSTQVDIDKRPVPERNLVLFGVTHRPDFSLLQGASLSVFLDEIDISSHLLIEGSSDAITASRTVGRMNYERLAYERFNERGKRSIHFLEEGVDRRPLSINYGVRPDLVDFYDVSFGLAHCYSIGIRDSERLLKAARMRLALQERESQGVDSEGTMTKISLALNHFSSNFSQYSAVSVIFKKFMGKVREYEVLAPRIINVGSSLKGKKVGIVGLSHLQLLSQHLRGDFLPRPLSWHDFVLHLDSSYVPVIKDIEERLFSVSH